MADVVVVGGGPAGSVAALVLARAGFEVVVVERARVSAAQGLRRVSRARARSSASTASASRRGGPRRGVAAARRPPADAARAGTGAAVRAGVARLRARHGSTRPAARAACRAGASIVRGARRRRASSRQGRVAGVRMRDDDGAPHDAARALGRRRRRRGLDGRAPGRVGAAAARNAAVRRSAGTTRGSTTSRAASRCTRARATTSPLNPLGGGLANAMLVVPRDARSPAGRAIVDAGMAGGGREAERRTTARCAHADRAGARIARRVRWRTRVRSPVAAGVVLAGDAAGFLDPFTGQGLYLAFTSGENAALAIVAAARRPRARERARSDATRASAVATSPRASGSPRPSRVLVDVPPLARRAAARLAADPEPRRCADRCAGRAARAAGRAARRSAGTAGPVIVTENARRRSRRRPRRSTGSRRRRSAGRRCCRTTASSACSPSAARRASSRWARWRHVLPDPLDGRTGQRSRDAAHPLPPRARLDARDGRRVALHAARGRRRPASRSSTAWQFVFPVAADWLRPARRRRLSSSTASRRGRWRA